MAKKSGPPSGSQPVLGPGAFELLATPQSVGNPSPSICLSITQFREFMRQYRSLDDGVTTRLNRVMARSRDMGLSSYPSLLSSHSSSSTSIDIGTSTYSVVPEAVCASFWQELMSAWTRREQAVRYCLTVAERSLVEKQAQAAADAGIEPGLDAERKDASLFASAASGRRSSSRDKFDDRSGRAEAHDEFMLRQLHNELAVESILRRRSLDVFKARCRTFQPRLRDEREHAMWEGKDTPAAQYSQQQAASV
ncbi:hypothetical protein K437DRAFT_240228 [Tilletiaria anomala UBC 951]|uniref:Caffeine-induced death protein 2 n=1 Tax=Tilletiaria anomala (strain ATCC 24038 / CBS 436.72 / UBC 951) TaxID=1037660 RepID=A0A066VHH6_TILAU|nr:uncharacterized protein K437DRAFT_240228 [Tilletiaria anomala UBC 951]KDN38204.1 hypothetical protein K437DRAFT_240228 [Tilletiaria anomala UBC 951]